MSNGPQSRKFLDISHIYIQVQVVPHPLKLINPALVISIAFAYHLGNQSILVDLTVDYISKVD